MTFDFSTACGQYFSTFDYGSPGHVSKLTFFIALRHVELTGDLDVACMYRTSASILGRLYELYAEGAIFIL